MMNQDGKLNTIDKTLNRVFGKHFDVFKKFAGTGEKFISNLI